LNVVLIAPFTAQSYHAGPFDGGQALVKENPWNHAAIDRNGKRVWQVDEPPD
jgi:hypothetical protein